MINYRHKISKLGGCKMNFKIIFENIYENIFDSLRRFSAKRTRIKQFKNKASTKVLSKEQIKELKDFYKPYKIPHLAFHRYFTEKTGEFHANYIPQDIYVGYIDPHFNNLREAKYIDNKCYYDMLFHQVPQPYLVLKRTNGVWLDHYGKVVDNSQIKSLISCERYGVFVKEAQVSAGGHGVLFVDHSNDAFDKIMDFSNKIKTDIVIQRKITQHADCAKFNSSSVNSLRIYSILDKNGTAKIYSAVLRIGVGDTKVDNYASGGVSCGITPDGHLKKFAYNKKGERVEKHPYTGVVFENCKIPYYDKAVELVKNIHPTISHFRSVSWDIAITEEGEPILIEANLCHGGIDLLQLSNGPLFGDDTKAILDEVFNK